MQITVKFFASLREQIGIDSQALEVDAPFTIAQVWQQTAQQPPADNLLCARNQQYADWNEALEEGDEVAFFPPVTGG